MLFKTILFIIGLFVIDHGLFYILKTLDSQNSYGENGGVQNYLLTQKKSLLVIGSSRAKHQIDDSKLSNNAFNAGINGQSIDYIYGFIHLLKSHNVLPDTIVWAVDEEQLLGDNKKADRAIVLGGFIQHNEIFNLISNSHGYIYASMLKYFPKSLRYHYKHRFIGSLRNYIMAKKGIQGFKPLNGKLETKNLINLKQSGVSRDKLILFKSIVQLLKNQNVTLITVTTPMINQNTVNINTVNKITSEYNIHHIPMDLISNPMFENTGLYRDQFHLNTDGVVYFNTILKQKLKSLFEIKRVSK